MPQLNPSLLVLLAQAHAPAKKSYLMWAFESMGIFYSLVLPAAGLAVFLGAILVVALNRRPGVIAAYLVFLPLPLLIGVFGSVHGLIFSLSAISSSGSDLPARVLVAAWPSALFTTYFALLVSFPSYFIVAIGLFVRAILWRPENSG